MTVQWRNVRLILVRELRDQLRDRRTLFMVAVLPLLLYPALGIGMLQLTMVFTEQPRNVVVLGAQDLPPPPLLEGDRFAAGWFDNPDSAAKLRVMTDLPPESDKPEERPAETPAGDKAPAEKTGPPKADSDSHAGGAPSTAEFIKRARLIQQKLQEKQQLTEKLAAAEEAHQQLEATAFRKAIEEHQQQLSELFAASEIQVLILVPEHFKENVLKVNDQLARKEQVDLTDYPRPVVMHNKADEKSLVAFNRVKDILREWEAKILETRLEIAGLPQSLPDPVQPVPEDLASKSQLQAVVWSKLFPALLVIMSITGAFYPAVDVCAGEKERGTMETLLICPARRIEIVLGKFLTVLCFSMATAVLNLISMGLTSSHIASMMRGPLSGSAAVSFPPFSALVWIVVLMLPLAAMFSALCLALATFARSSKEGQYYLTPLLMFTLGLTVFCLSPGVELNPFYSILPIAGVALLLKGLLLNAHDAVLYWYALPVLITSIGYSLLSLWWAIDQFQQEEVLFREAERFELGLWLKHLLRDKEPTPSFAEGMFCFLLILLLQFASFKNLSQASLGPDGLPSAINSMKVLLVQQLAIIATPALLMGVMLTTSVRRTFRLYWPGLKWVAMGAILAFAAHPLAIGLAQLLEGFFPPLSESIQRTLQMMSSKEQPLWLVLTVFALAPGFCEEIAFRGFILSGLGHSGRRGLAIVLSALLFGLFHMIPQQVFNASLLGLVLGLLACQSRSLLPSIMFHIGNNSIEVIRGRLQQAWTTPTGGDFSTPFLKMQEGQLTYGPASTALASVVFIAGLWWVIRQPSADPQEVTLPDAGEPTTQFVD